MPFASINPRLFKSWDYLNSTQWCRNRGGQGGHWPPQYLADQLTLFQPWGADSAHPLLVAPPMFFTFRHHCELTQGPNHEIFVKNIENWQFWKMLNFWVGHFDFDFDFFLIFSHKKQVKGYWLAVGLRYRNFTIKLARGKKSNASQGIMKLGPFGYPILWLFNIVFLQNCVIYIS